MKSETVKLLVVDDDRMMLEFTERALISLGFSCVTVTDAATAFRLLDQDREIRVLITDMRLGQGMTGGQLAGRAFEIRPDLGVILTSGDPRLLQDAGRDMPQHVELLTKPYRRFDLTDRLSRLL